MYLFRGTQIIFIFNLPPIPACRYNETMQTIAAWEAEKKANARRQKQLKDEVWFCLFSEDLSERRRPRFVFINLRSFVE